MVWIQAEHMHHAEEEKGQSAQPRGCYGPPSPLFHIPPDLILPSPWQHLKDGQGLCFPLSGISAASEDPQPPAPLPGETPSLCCI